jgi:hypothetical protein
MSSNGAISIITDNLVINKVFAVQDDGNPCAQGQVLVTQSDGTMAYRPYDTTGVFWYDVPAETDVCMKAHSILDCPNMVSTITTDAILTNGNCINLTEGIDGSGNKSYDITTNITAGLGIQLIDNGSGGIQINNTDSGSLWYEVPAGTNVNFSGNQLENVGTISNSMGVGAGTIDISGNLNISGNIYNDSGSVIINDTLDLSGNNITGVTNIIATGDISGGTITGQTVNFTNTNLAITADNSGALNSGIEITGSGTNDVSIKTLLAATGNLSITNNPDVSGGLLLDITGGGASQWIITQNNDGITYTNDGSGGNIGIDTITPIACVDAEGGSSGVNGRYFTESGSTSNITIPTGVTQMYVELIGAGNGINSTYNAGYFKGYIDVTGKENLNVTVTVSDASGSIITGPASAFSITASNALSGANGTVNKSGTGITSLEQYSGVTIPSYLLPNYGRGQGNGLVYISFGQPSIRATGDIISGGNIVSNGSVDCNTLVASSNITATGSVSCNTIYTQTIKLAEILYSNDTTAPSPLPIPVAPPSGNITLLSLIQEKTPNYPYTSGYVRVSILVVGGGASGAIPINSGGGGGGSGQEISGIYYLPVTADFTISLGNGGVIAVGSSGGNPGGNTYINFLTQNINIIAYGAPGLPDTGQGGNGYYGGGGGGASLGGFSGGISYIGNGFGRAGHQFTGAYNGGNGDGPNSEGGTGGIGNSSGQYGGGGGGSSSIGQGGAGASVSTDKGSNGINGSGGGGSNSGGNYSGNGGSGAVYIQIFSV